jgi:hypothetical protein
LCSLGNRFPLLLLGLVLIAFSFCGLRLIDKLVTSEGIVGLANGLLKCALDI